MNKINNLVKDILYISKLTKTKNKKVLNYHLYIPISSQRRS